MRRNEKEQLREELHNIFNSNPNALLVGFSGLTVNDAVTLRRKLHEANCEYKVVKNRIAKIAAEGTPMEMLVSHFEGTTAVAYNEDDPVTLAKIFKDFVKENKALSFKAFLVEGQPYPGEQVDIVAKMPSRDELITQLAFMLKQPITSLARVLQAPLRDLSTVLKQLEEKKS